MQDTPNQVHRLAPQRRNKIHRQIKRSGLDSMLVTDEKNVTYLTGFTGDSSYLWLTSDQAVLLSDSRYTTQISEECPDLETMIRDAGSTTCDLAAKIAKTCNAKTIGIEPTSVTKSLYDRINSATASELVDTDSWVETLRAIKDKHEISTIRRSIRIAEQAFSVIRAQMTVDQTERQIAHNLEHQIRAFGGSGCSFEPIVGIGPRAALPHGIPSNRRIGQDPFVLIDWGAQYNGYASDLTRVLVTAKIPPKLRKIHEIVLKAQLAAIAKIRPGVCLQRVDKAARSLIERAGFGKQFGHGLGHGFGLRIHESPFLSPIYEGQLAAGMVVTIEPGIYVPGWGGVRIEDDVLVTKEGCEVLSSLPKSLDECVVGM
ncbi:MAG: Xaa-Pro peptidase family protein [Mariniblastus sp.]|nr:Xaa-Pro peptidase family protein [Mariniblastus sp.]